MNLSGGVLPINNVYASVQGEGCLTGVPMWVLRLQGCEVGCPFCDTKETWALDEANRVLRLQDALGPNPKWVALSGSEVAAALRDEGRIRWGEGNGPKWVMLTGGEPADHYLKPLICALHDAGYKVALETSGTATGHLGAGLDWVCVSPKIAMPGGRKVLPLALSVADEIKHVVGKPDHIAALDHLLAECADSLKVGVTVCLQPMSTGKRATALCQETCLQRGWRLSVQVHKLLDMP